jgi:hypothetical protein
MGTLVYSDIVRRVSALQMDVNITFSNYTTPDNTTASPVAKATFVMSIILRASVCIACVILLVLCFIKRNKQPVTSRLFVPYVFLISKIFNNIASVQTVFPSAWQRYSAYTNQQIGCYVGLWVVVPMYIVSILCIAFMFLRFFVLQWFSFRTIRTQELRRDLLKSSNKGATYIANRAKLVDRMIKVTMSPLMIAIAITLCVLSVYIIGAIDLGRRGDQVSCTDEWSADLQYAAVLARYEIVVIVVICIICVILVLFDLIANEFLPKLIKRKITLKQFLVQLFMESDPLRYRMELYCMAIPGACLGLILGIFGIVANVQGQAEYFNLIKTFLYVFFWEYPSMVVLPGITLVCAFKWDRREHTSKEKRKTMVAAMRIAPELLAYADLDIAQFNDAPVEMWKIS